MDLLWSIFFTFWNFLPWVFIAMMAALSLRKRRESRSLLMQAVGAGLIFLFGILQWVVNGIMSWFNAGPDAFRASGNIFAFLLFVGLVIFAVGYCIERFRRKEPISVSANPA